jgi:hypothetical protein
MSLVQVQVLVLVKWKTRKQGCSPGSYHKAKWAAQVLGSTYKQQAQQAQQARQIPHSHHAHSHHSQLGTISFGPPNRIFQHYHDCN